MSTVSRHHRLCRGGVALATAALAALSLGAMSSPASAARARVDSTEQVSVGPSGTSADGASSEADIDRRGRRVAFTSEATTLVTGDDNGHADVFVRDRRTNQTMLASAGPDGSAGNGGSGSPALSANGRFVAFDSFSSDLVVGDSNDANDVFVRDLTDGVTTLVSVDLSGGPSDAGSTNPSISADGRYVAFQSTATDLVDGPDDAGTSDVFVRDLVLGMTFPVSVDIEDGAPDGQSFAPSISADGQRVAFWSAATDLVEGDANGFDDVFVRDLGLGTTQRVSVSPTGGEANQTSRDPDLSANGKRVAFVSRANNLVAGDRNGLVADVFVRNLVSGNTVRASLDAAGGDAGDDSSAPALNRDGTIVAFASQARDLVGHRQRDFVEDVYVRDLRSGTTTVVSRNSAHQAPGGSSEAPAITPDARMVAFVSAADDLVAGDANQTTDVFTVRVGIRR